MNNTETYKIELTENEILKLTVFILQFQEKVISESNAFEDLSKEINNFDANTIEIFKSNSEYYKNMYETIIGIRYKLDEIPF